MSWMFGVPPKQQEVWDKIPSDQLDAWEEWLGQKTLWEVRAAKAIKGSRGNYRTNTAWKAIGERDIVSRGFAQKKIPVVDDEGEIMVVPHRCLRLEMATTIRQANPWLMLRDSHERILSAIDSLPKDCEVGRVWLPQSPLYFSWDHKPALPESLRRDSWERPECCAVFFVDQGGVEGVRDESFLQMWSVTSVPGDKLYFQVVGNIEWGRPRSKNCKLVQDILDILWVADNMPLARERKAALPKGGNKRSKRKHSPVDVSVIDLRRIRASGPAGDAAGEPVERSFRWHVRGHARNQPVGPGRKDRCLIWVDEHLKGPEGKPIKPQVHRVIR